MGSIKLKTDKELEIIKESAEILSRTHELIAQNVKPGVSTASLDKLAEEFVLSHGGKPSFKGYNGFPYSLCISVNEQVVHGFPSSYMLKDGDIVSIDCGVYFNGFHSDCAFTYPVGEVNEQTKALMLTTLESLQKGIDATVLGNRIGDVGFEIQNYVEPKGYSVVRELVGHGVGKQLHESPEVPNYGKRGRGPKIENGMVIAIEPMINLGDRRIVQEKDGWTIRTRDRKPSAHYEHTVAVIDGKGVPLTTFEYINKWIKI